MRLFFVCEISNEVAFTCGPERKGYLIEIPTALLVALKYVLIASISVIKVLMTVNGIPGGLLPNIPVDLGNSAKYIENLFDQIPSDEKLEKVKTKFEKLNGLPDKIQDIEDQMTSIQEGDVVELFKLIQKSEVSSSEDVLLGWTPKFVGLHRISPNSGVLGGSKWVLEAYRELYSQLGDPAAKQHLENAKSLQMIS